jgi:hypothetical protein
MVEPSPEDQTPGYSTITIDSVSFNRSGFEFTSGETDKYNTGFVDVPVISQNVRNNLGTPEVFVVGIHSVDDGPAGVGSGEVGDPSSLIGLKVLEPGTSTDVDVPVFPVANKTDIRTFSQSEGIGAPPQVFPPIGDSDIQAALYTSDIFQDLMPDPVATTDAVTVTNGLDQNGDRKPLKPTEGGALEESQFVTIELKNTGDEPVELFNLVVGDTTVISIPAPLNDSLDDVDGPTPLGDTIPPSDALDDPDGFPIPPGETVPFPDVPVAADKDEVEISVLKAGRPPAPRQETKVIPDDGVIDLTLEPTAGGPVGPEFVDIGPLGSSVGNRFDLPAEPQHIALSPLGDVGAIGGGGVVQIVRRSGGQWQKNETLEPDDATGQFGSSIAIGEETIVAGDPSGVGKAYVFESGGGSFSKAYEFPNDKEDIDDLPSGVTSGSDLGSIVAVNDTVDAGDSVFAAKFQTDVSAVDESQHVATFSRSGGNWALEDDAQLEPSGNLLLQALGLGGSGVSAPTLVAGISSIQGDFTGNNQGRIDVFELEDGSFPRKGGSVTPTKELDPVSDVAFGRNVSIQGDRIAATTFDNTDTYVYEEMSGSYSQLKNSPFKTSGDAGGDITAGVGLGGSGKDEFLLVGTPDDQKDPPQTDTSAAGSVLLYRLDGSGSEEDEIIVSPTDVSVGFGNKIAVGGDSAFGLTQGQFGEGTRRRVSNRVFAFDIPPEN